jgi:hypothetical protein
MNSSDFYLFFCTAPIGTSNPEFKIKGATKFGNWYLEVHEVIRTSKNNSEKFSLGLANDRKGSRFEINIGNENIVISTEKFGINPIFYSQVAGDIHISSSIEVLIERLKPKYNLHINKRYILEQNLFNYSLFESTIFEEIKILPSNSTVEITDYLSIKESFSIEDYFTDTPIPYKKCIQNLVDLFISQTSQRILNGDYISFTSGFDGRSLVALSKYHNKEISTYSFGTETNEDLYLPREQALILGIDFSPIYLDSNAYHDKFWKLGTDIIRKSGGATNFLQVHWAYSAKLLSQNTNTIISGVFGSELFRSAHISGQFTSQALIDYFKNIESDDWILKIRNGDSLKFLNMENFKNEMDELIEELRVYKNRIIHLNPNQRFYKYIFDEVFRKFFGMQFLQPQNEYVNVISPFLDFIFIKELLKTELAGVNNEFFTNNPFRRFKGQLFYANLIAYTCPELLKLTTGKGYSPRDLLSFIGKTNIAYHYFKKRIKRSVGGINLDNLGVISAYEANKNRFDKVKISEDLFNKKPITELRKNDAWKTNILIRDKFIETLSLNNYIQENK